MEPVTVLSGGAAKSGLQEAIRIHEGKTGTKVKADYQPMGRLTHLDGGARPDVVVVTREVLDQLAAKGQVKTGTAVEVGRVAIGVAVKEGAPLPDIRTPEAFKATLLNARSIIMVNPATGTSGKHLASVFADLGIAEALKPKLKYLDGGYVVEPVGRCEVELGLHQITEILPVAGVQLAGPVPEPYQKITIYVAALAGNAPSPAAGQRFLDELRTPEVRSAIAAKGYAVAP